MNPLLILGGLVLLAIFVMFFYISRKERKGSDYYCIFIIGIIWLGFGLAIKNYALSAIGFISLIFGLGKKKKWGKNLLYDEDEKLWRIILIIFFLVLMFSGVLLFFLFEKGMFS